MKTIFLLLASFVVIALGGCYVIPYDERGDGHRGDREHRDDRRGGEHRDHDRFR
jgi:hypothetical protein